MKAFDMAKGRGFARRRWKFLACAFGIAAGACALAAWAGRNVSINMSASLPGHVYIRSSRPLARGEIVNWCPEDPRVIAILRTITPYRTSESARCRSGEMPLLKIVRAMPGDRVRANGLGRITVNGEIVPATAPNPFLPLPAWKFDGVIPEGRILLYGLNPDSFDSRYLGMFPASGVESVMVKVF